MDSNGVPWAELLMACEVWAAIALTIIWAGWV
jgi:hypothetical protein